MSSVENWKELVLGGKDGQEVSDVEKPVPGSNASYPLLGGEAGPLVGELGNIDWRLRLALTDSLPVELRDSFAESVDEILTTEASTKETVSESALEMVDSGEEIRVRVDLNLLRNITEIRRMKDQAESTKSWVLVTTGSKESDPEHLVGETIRQLTGILAGCEVLEIRQGEGEELSSVWSRLNVARLLRSESELGQLNDPIQGAGFFSVLGERLGS